MAFLSTCRWFGCRPEHKWAGGVIALLSAPGGGRRLSELTLSWCAHKCFHEGPEHGSISGTQTSHLEGSGEEGGWGRGKEGARKGGIRFSSYHRGLLLANVVLAPLLAGGQPWPNTEQFKFSKRALSRLTQYGPATTSGQFQIVWN